MMQPTRDIMTIVGLFFILTIVDLLHHATTKFVSHTLHRETKKKGKIPFPSSNPNPNCNTTP